nr:hypothetical protein Iba_scaffold20340CG0020 [Ipomoea batatas]
MRKEKRRRRDTQNPINLRALPFSFVIPEQIGTSSKFRMAMGDGISPAKPLTASCEAFFRRNLLRGILCIEMAHRESLFPANGTLPALDSLCNMALVLDLTKNRIGDLEFRQSWGW